MNPEIGEVLISGSQIKARIAELGALISADYAGKEVLLVGVLKGAIMFMVDLARVITVPLVIDFMAVSSYGTSTKSSGIVRILKDLDESVEGRHVLLAEDVIDSGLTLEYVKAHLSARNPASLKVVAFLQKQRPRAEQASADYLGFEIPDVFVIGYGLDKGEHFRNLYCVAEYRPID